MVVAAEVAVTDAVGRLFDDGKMAPEMISLRIGVSSKMDRIA